MVHLDQTKHIQCSSATEFLGELLKCVTADPKASGIWPLVCQVKIKCNSKALETGIVLVDLPGEGDTNVARNHASRSFFEKAEHFWIVAPTTRAIDDASSKSELKI